MEMYSIRSAPFAPLLPFAVDADDVFAVVFVACFRFRANFFSARPVDGYDFFVIHPTRRAL